MEALVYTFLLVLTLGIILFALFFRQLKSEILFHYLN